MTTKPPILRQTSRSGPVRSRRKRPDPVRPGHDDARFQLANRVFFRLYQSSNLMHRTGSRAVARHHATTQQWAVMGALAHPGNVGRGLTVKDLMQLLAVSRQSLTIVLKRLEGLGLVERERSAGDGRLRRIRLTSHGAEHWATMLGDIRPYYGAALAEFSDEEAGVLLGWLDRLTSALRSMELVATSEAE